MTWLKTKAFLYSAGALGLTILGFLARIFFLKRANNKLTRERDHLKAKSEHQTAVANADNVIDAEFRSRRAEAKSEVEAGRNNPVFTDPNELFKPKDRD